MIELTDVTKRYGATVAVDRLSFEVRPGEVTGFLLFLAQLAVGVLGVLVVTSEYATGQIRATLGATPQRLTVLAAPATTFTGVVLATGLVASFAAFWTGQLIFASKGLDASISDTGVLGAVPDTAAMSLPDQW